jgi:hypothetical protein
VWLPWLILVVTLVCAAHVAAPYVTWFKLAMR